MKTKKDIIIEAHLEETLETAIYDYIREKVLSDTEYTLYDIEDRIIQDGWGHIPTTLFLRCYRNAVNFFVSHFNQKEVYV